MSKIVTETGMAWCSKCKQALPEESFHFNKNRKCDGYCKECRKAYYLARSTCSRRVIPPPGKKYCGRCKTIKDDEEFSASQHTLRQGRKAKRSACCRACIHTSLVSDADPRCVARYSDSHQCFKSEISKVSSDTKLLAYAAGVVDAEGTVSLRTTSTSHPVFSISNDSEAILDASMRAVGGRKKFSDRIKTLKNGDTVAISSGRLIITSILEIRDACVALMPFLILKKRRAEIVLQASMLAPSDRRKLKSEMRELNKKCISDVCIVPQKNRLETSAIVGISDEKFAYLAGMLDGDGWVGFRFGVPCLIVSVTKACIPLWIHSVFGGCVRTTKGRGNGADKYSWTSSFSKNTWKDFMPKLISFLVLKKQHAALALSAIDMDREGQSNAVIQMKTLTALAHQEKFERVAERLKNDPGRVMYDRDGKIAEIMEPEEALNMRAHFDEKYAREDMWDALSDVCEARDPRQRRYDEIVPGWDAMSQKEKEGKIKDDYNDVMFDVQDKHQAELKTLKRAS